MGYRELSTAEYRHWLKKYYLPASQNLSELRNELMERANDKIERNIQLLGVTGIEDTLQPGTSLSLSLSCVSFSLMFFSSGAFSLHIFTSFIHSVSSISFVLVNNFDCRSPRDNYIVVGCWN
jgi:hypothetical protein